MPFSSKIKQKALINSRRCCCVCNEFIGRNANVHHIIPEAKGGPNTIANAIVLCFKCHAEAGHYNHDHPLGIKYSPDELRKQRDFWWKWVNENPSRQLPKFPLLISPESFRINATSWNYQFSLKIFNRIDEPVYQTWVKIATDSLSVDLRKISITPISITPGDETEVSFSDNTWNTKYMKFNGKDETKKSAIYLVINNIDPNHTISFKVENKNSIFLPGLRAQIYFSIIDFYRDPPTIVSKDNQAAMSILPPEGITIENISIMNRKKSYK